MTMSVEQNQIAQKGISLIRTLSTLKEKLKFHNKRFCLAWPHLSDKMSSEELT